MIEHIEIEGFKSLEKVSLDLGPLNIFVGTNASGKSNFLEALRVLQGIGYGYTIDEIFNGRPKLGNNEAWEGIRGGSNFAEFLSGSPGDIQFLVRASTPATAEPLTYTVAFSPRSTRLYRESLSIGATIVFDAEPFSLRPVLGQPSADIVANQLREQFADLQMLQPSASLQRAYSTASRALRMGDRGENFAALLKTILSDPDSASAYVSWLKELTPAELDSIEILNGPAGDFTFAFRKNGVDHPARVLSDGTLRFAAIAAAFFQLAPPHLLLLEEMEEGLHPSRLQLLIELLKSQTGHGVEQVFATSHSPYAIAWLDEEDYKHVFLCTKNEDTGATSITPFSEVPRLVELARTQSIADLFAEGWMENAF